MHPLELLIAHFWTSQSEKGAVTFLANHSQESTNPFKCYCWEKNGHFFQWTVFLGDFSPFSSEKVITITQKVLKHVWNNCKCAFITSEKVKWWRFHEKDQKNEKVWKRTQMLKWRSSMDIFCWLCFIIKERTVSYQEGNSAGRIQCLFVA